MFTVASCKWLEAACTRHSNFDMLIYFYLHTHTGIYKKYDVQTCSMGIWLTARLNSPS